MDKRSWMYGPELKNGRGGCHEGLGYVCTLSQIDNESDLSASESGEMGGTAGVFMHK